MDEFLDDVIDFVMKWIFIPFINIIDGVLCCGFRLGYY